LRVLSILLEESTLATTSKCVYFIYILLPLHVSAPVGHHQAEYTTIPPEDGQQEPKHEATIKYWIV
jgi:hypothetical protein